MKTLLRKASSLIGIALLFSTAGNFVSAQQILPCGTDKMMAEMMQKDPQIVIAQQELEAYTKEFIRTHKSEMSERGGPQYVIPVVFHIVHDFGAENISDATVISAVNTLNRDYQKLNTDTSQVIPQFKALVADCNIEFRLAQIDPDGNCTNGIDRVFSYRTYQGNDRSKVVVWNRRHYLNIWVVNRIASGGVAAYAYLPSGASGLGYKVDGVIAWYQYVLPSGPGPRTLTHEIGHCFNLSHPWGGGEVGTACGDDGVDDTPITEGFLGSCPSNRIDFSCDKDTIKKTWQFNNVTTTSGTTDPNGTMYVPGSDTSVTLLSFSAHNVDSNSSVDSAFAFAGWDTGGIDGDNVFYDHTDTISLGKFYEFKVRPEFGQGMPKFGQGVTLTGIRFYVKRSPTGPRMFSIRSSEFNNFNTNLTASVSPANPNLNVQVDTLSQDALNRIIPNIFYFATDSSVLITQAKITLTGNHANTDDTITFRIYAWNAEDAAGYLQIDSVAIIGFYGTIENLDNYMDYAYCDHMFTIGQKERMHAALNSNTSYRDSLWQPENHVRTGIDNPQPCAPEADFYTLKTMACQNGPGTVQFYDYSHRGTPTSWAWSFPGGTPSTSTAPSPTVTFNTPYNQSATLTVTNAQGSSTVTKNNMVWVQPPWVDYHGLFYEDFEDPARFNTQWLVDNRSSNSSVWQVTNTGTFPSGNHGLKINAYSPMVLSTNTTPTIILDWGIGAFDKDAFVSPALDLDYITNGTGKLEFKLTGATRATDPADITDSLQVLYSINCGNTWSAFPGTGTAAGRYSKANLNPAGSWQGEYAPTTTTQWVQKSINLPVAALAPNVRFKFEYFSGDFSNDIYIDDINISGTVGIDDNSPGAMADLMVFPNPAGSEVSVTYRLPASKNIKLEVFDAVGNLVYELVNKKQSAGGYTVTFNTSTIANGIYYVKLMGDNVNLKTEKIVVIK
jgi:PKD repeat protein